METFSETQQVLGRQRKGIQWMFGLHVAIYAAALGLIFVSQPLGIAVGLANAAYYLLWLRRQMKAYDSSMARACVVYGLCQPWQDVVYMDDHSLTSEDLRALRMLPLHDVENALLSRHGFSATAGTLGLTGSEITLHYPALVGNRDSYKFLSGTLLTARDPVGGSDGDWLLLANGLLEPYAQETFLAQCEYSPSASGVGNYAFYHHGPVAVPPVAVLRRIEKLTKHCPAVGAVRLWQSGAAIFIKGRFYTGRYRPNIAPDEALLRQNSLPERDEAMAFFRFWSQFESQKN